MVCFFVCLFCLFVDMNPENYIPPPVGKEVNPLGVVTQGQMHKPPGSGHTGAEAQTAKCILKTATFGL